MGGGEYLPRSPKHSDLCAPNGLMGPLAKDAAASQTQPLNPALSRGCKEGNTMTELERGDKVVSMGRRCKSTNDLKCANIEHARPLASSENNMRNFEEEFHTVEDDDLDLDDTFFDATESRMTARPSFLNDCRFRINFQTGLILHKEELQNRKEVYLLQNFDELHARQV